MDETTRKEKEMILAGGGQYARKGDTPAPDQAVARGLLEALKEEEYQINRLCEAKDKNMGVCWDMPSCLATRDRLRQAISEAEAQLGEPEEILRDNIKVSKETLPDGTELTFMSKPEMLEFEIHKYKSECYLSYRLAGYYCRTTFSVVVYDELPSVAHAIAKSLGMVAAFPKEKSDESA